MPACSSPDLVAKFHEEWDDVGAARRHAQGALFHSALGLSSCHQEFAIAFALVIRMHGQVADLADAFVRDHTHTA